jgi:spore coat polysaccharide biosynthesis predicted glycosyltransferase SpsG
MFDHKKININVRNILITCGESDPKNITLAILNRYYA